MALRLGVGWHFFKEGAKKFTDAGVPSVAFLRSATGPLADMYKSFIPDRYGTRASVAAVDDRVLESVQGSSCAALTALMRRKQKKPMKSSLGTPRG